MRRLLFALTWVVLPLAAGCRNGPSRADGDNPPDAASPSADPAAQALEAQKKKQSAIASVLTRGGMVQVDPEDWQQSVVLVDLHGFYKVVDALDSLAPLTRLRILNLYDTAVTDADLERLRGLSHLQELNLSDTKITDEGLAIVQTLSNLRKLHLNETRITDAGLQYLRGLPHLQELSLYKTKVTDKGLAQLRDMETLQKLVLGGSRSITDRGMMHLAAMSQLREVTLLSTAVSKSGIEELKFASSHLRIIK